MPEQATTNKQLRTSSYTIYVDLPDEQEYVLLVHGYSGAYDKVSRRVANFVRSLEIGALPKPLYGEWSIEKIDGVVPTPSDETINILTKRGYLTEMSREEEQVFFTKIGTTLHSIQSRMMPGYIVMPTYQCNLRCPYCFQDHMRTNPLYKHLLRTMSFETADRLLNAMPQFEALHGVPDGAAGVQVPRSITFFGGEPLLAESYPVVEYIVGQTLAKGKANFSAITNGTELHHYKALLAPDKISFLQITLDGPPKEHDKRRIYADGSGSFELIARNIDMALELGVYISVRMNIDRNNIHQLPELADEIVRRGWHAHKKFSSYTAVVAPSNEKTDFRTTMTSWELGNKLKELNEQHENMWVIGKPDDGLTDAARRLFDTKQQGMPSLKGSFCGAHNKMYVYDAFGDLYACWERTGDPQVRIGHVSEAGELVLNVVMNKVWRERTAVSNPTCAKCRYALYCGGGCAVHAEEFTGTVYSNFCDGFQKRFRASVAEAYIDHIEGKAPKMEVARACEM